MDEYKRMGEILRGLRTGHEMSLEEVSRISGYDLGGLSRVERGLRRVTGAVFAAYSTALGIEPLDLALTLGYPVAERVGPAPRELPRAASKSQQVRDLMRKEPALSPREIAIRLNVDPQVVSNIRWRENVRAEAAV